MDEEDEASRCAMEAADESVRNEGTEIMLTPIPGPPKTRGVKAIRTSKGNLLRNAGIVARKATGRASAEKNTDKGNRQRSHYAEGPRKAEKGPPS